MNRLQAAVKRLWQGAVEDGPTLHTLPPLPSLPYDIPARAAHPIVFAMPLRDQIVEKAMALNRAAKETGTDVLKVGNMLMDLYRACDQYGNELNRQLYPVDQNKVSAAMENELATGARA